MKNPSNRLSSAHLVLRREGGKGCGEPAECILKITLREIHSYFKPSQQIALAIKRNDILIDYQQRLQQCHEYGGPRKREGRGWLACWRDPFKILWQNYLKRVYFVVECLEAGQTGKKATDKRE